MTLTEVEITDLPEKVKILNELIKIPGGTISIEGDRKIILTEWTPTAKEDMVEVTIKGVIVKEISK